MQILYKIKKLSKKINHSIETEMRSLKTQTYFTGSRLKRETSGNDMYGPIYH